MSNLNFFRVLQSGGVGGSSGEIDWDDFTESSHFTSSINSSDIDVNPNQTEIFFSPSNTKRIDVYDFNTTGDISDGITFSTTGTTLDKWVFGFQFNPTGTKVFALMSESLGGVRLGIYQYNLTTAWDTSTMSSTYDEYVAFSTLDSNIAFGGTSITAPSDERYKESIADSTAGLSFINDLRPVTFQWKKAKDIPSDMKAHVADSEERVMNGKYNHGFIAQEVKEVIDKHGLKDGFDMWTEDDADGRQRIGEGALIPMLVKAIQELSAEVEELKSKSHDKCDK